MRITWYPIESEIEYKVSGRAKVLAAGHGLTVSMSKAKIRFKPEAPVVPGSWVEVWVDWPARLENRVGLRLHAHGEIGEPENGCAVLHIMRHDFRIAPKSYAIEEST